MLCPLQSISVHDLEVSPAKAARKTFWLSDPLSPDRRPPSPCVVGTIGAGENGRRNLMRIGKVAGSILAIAFAAVTHAAIAQLAILKRVPVPASAGQCVAVNPTLNRIYLSGGASANQQVAELSGATYAIVILGPGSGASVDLATNRVWAAGVYDGSALVYDGVSRQLIQTVRLLACPVGTGYDSKHGRAWVGAQCGAGNDPTFAVDGSTYQVEAKPIGSGGVYWGNPIANPATGKVYFGASSATNNGPPMSLSIDPANNFAQTVQSFGSVGAVDEVHNLLFAVPSAGGAQLQIVTDGPGPGPVVRTVNLPFTVNAGALAVNPVLGHLYAANSQRNSIEVLNEKTGARLKSIALGAGNNVIRMAADSRRNRLYALVQTANGTQLFVIRD